MVSPNLVIEESYEGLSREASKKIIEIIKENPSGLYCFAGGDTPIKTLELLVKAHHNQEVDLHKAFYIQLDEWVGIESTHKGSCQSYLKNNFFDPANIPPEHVHLLDGMSNDLENECKKATNYIEKHKGLTLCLLGVGVNGHLGFNEPGSYLESKTHVVKLSETTTTVGEKYFSEKTKATQGITLGLKPIMESKVVILEANGNTKIDAIKKLREEKITTEWPVTFLNLHPNCMVFVDKETL